MKPNENTKADLSRMQSLPLAEKVLLSRERIREWVEYWDGKVYVSFSGGKDSTVLLSLVRAMYPKVPAVFSDTGLEYPEVRNFVRQQSGVTVIRPKMTFAEVVRTVGYPILSKSIASTIRVSRRFDMEGRNRWYFHQPTYVDKDGRVRASLYDRTRWRPVAELAPFRISDQCCGLMKKRPMHLYEKETGRHGFVGTMTEEGRLRERAWLMHGCNAYEAGNQLSTPLAFWREQDILQYIDRTGLEIAPVYGDVTKDCATCRYRTTGAHRTGCVFCAFGAHLGRRDRFLQLKETHPQLYAYCMNGGEWVPNPAYDPNMPPVADDGFRNWNPPRLWQPDSRGLGMRFVFEWLNETYGKELISY